MDTETFDQILRPLVRELADICEKANIPMVARIDHNDNQGYIRAVISPEHANNKTLLLYALAQGKMPTRSGKTEDFSTTDEFKAELDSKLQVIRDLIKEHNVSGCIHIVTDGNSTTHNSLDLVHVGPDTVDSLYLMGQVMSNDLDANKNLAKYFIIKQLIGAFGGNE